MLSIHVQLGYTLQYLLFSSVCDSIFIVLVSVTLEVTFLYNVELKGIRNRIYINMS